MGVVITEIPFCTKEQIRNQNDALIWGEIFLYLFSSLLIIFHSFTY